MKIHLIRRFNAVQMARVCGLLFICLIGLAMVLSAPMARAEVSLAPLDKAMQAVLTVRSGDEESRFLGSAFLWDVTADPHVTHDLAVTNAHVVGAADEVRLVDRDGREAIGLVIARDAVRDVAVISLGRDGAPRQGLLPAPEPAALAVEVFALGAPLGVEFTLTEGRISAAARQVDVAVPILMLQHDAAVNPGSSGGPLVDAEGRLIGMNSQIANGSRMFVGIAYAIAAPDLVRIVQGLIDETLVPYPVLGLTVRPVDRRLAAMLSVAPKGLLVEGTAKGGLTAAAGLQAGDILLAVNGRPIQAPGDFAFLIEAALPDEEASLTLIRQGKPLTLDLSFTPSTADGTAFGVTLRDIDTSVGPERIRSYSLAALGLVLSSEGRVKRVTPSALDSAGIAPGERILAVNGIEMDGKAMKTLEITAAVVLRIAGRDGQTRHVVLDPWRRETGARPAGGANVLDPSVIVF